MGYLTNLLPYWHSIETLPRTAGTVLGYYEDKYGGHYAIITYTQNHEWWFPGSDKNDYKIIAWQELPNKPLFKRVDKE